MIAWATAEAAIKSAVQDASGVTDVAWRHEPSKMRGKITINLERSPMTVVGSDERRRAYDAADGLVATQVSARQFRVVLRCESDKGTPSDTTYVDSADILGLLQTRIRRPSIIADLRAASMALSSVGPATRVEYRSDGRAISAAVVELVLLIHDADVDGSDDWFNSVEATSDTLDHATGTPGPLQPIIEAP